MLPLIICRSYFTFLEGVHSISDIVNFAREKGVKAICLADRNGLYGAIEFYSLCQETGIQPLIGVDLVCGNRHVTAIAKNLSGYQVLSGLVTQCQLNDISNFQELMMDSPDLLLICADTFLLQQWSQETKHANIFIGLSLTKKRNRCSLLNFLTRHGDMLQIPAVPILELNPLTKDDVLIYMIVRAIDCNCTVDTLPEEELSEWKTWRESLSLGSKIKGALNSRDTIRKTLREDISLISGDELAKLCNLKFDLGKYHLPRFSLT
jgi:DNA polymerase III alpha subunit